MDQFNEIVRGDILLSARCLGELFGAKTERAEIGALILADYFRIFRQVNTKQ